MENSFLLFLTTAVTALAVENAVFARGLGIGRSTMFMNSAFTGILMGGAFTWMITLSSLLVALMNFLLRDNPYIALIRPVAYLLSIFFVYTMTIFLLTRVLMPKREALAKQILGLMPVSTFNSALFAAFYISASQNFLATQTLGYALGTGVGYTAATLIIHYAKKRLAISPVPRSFRGLPVLLVYLGLVSLALYGLIGHNLPT